MKTIIILGGGVGGIITANTLAKKLKKKHRIILIDKEAKHTFASSLLWVANGSRKYPDITRELSNLNKKGIEFIKDEIESITPETKEVVVNQKNIKGDYLVIALGAQTFDGLKIGEKGFNLYAPEGSEGLHKALLTAKENANVAVLISSLPFKCPAAPYEAALLIKAFLKKQRIKANVSLYSPEPGPMGVAGKKLSGMVRSMVESKGISYFPQYQVESVSIDSLSFNNGQKAGFDILAYIPNHECPKVVKDAGLTGESGWVQIENRNTMETKFPGVYAIGDITNIPLALGKPLPKAGVFAHYQAETVANNISVEILEKGEKQFFIGDGMCFIEMGHGKAGFAKGNFYAEPLPQVKMFMSGYHWHWGKILFEKRFLSKWF